MNGGKICENCAGGIAARRWKMGRRRKRQTHVIKVGRQSYWVHYGERKFGSWGLKELMNVEIEERKFMKV